MALKASKPQRVGQAFCFGSTLACWLFPVFSHVVQNWHIWAAMARGTLLAMVLAIGALIWACRACWTTFRIRTCLLIAGGVLFVFFYGPAGKGSDLLYASFGWWFSQNRCYAVIGAVILGWAIATYWRDLNCQFSAFLAILAIAGLALCYQPTVQRKTATTLQPQAAAANRPNIYYIIMDAHPSYDNVMKDFASREAQMGFVALGKRGLVSLEGGKSNYIQTRQTLGAIFNLSYLPVEGGRLSPHFLYPLIRDLPDQAPLERELIKVGYHSLYMNSTSFPCRPGDQKCIMTPDTVRIRAIAFSILSNTPLSNFKRLFQRELRVDGLAALRSRRVDQLLDQQKPFMILVHQLSPHPPYHYGPRCTPMARSARLDSWRHGGEGVFANEIKCLFTDVLATIDHIVARDPAALIVLQGDHGAGFDLKDELGQSMANWTPQGLAQRTSFLNRVRLPRACLPMATPGLGQINTARLVLGCVSGRPARYLKEQTILTSYYSNAAMDMSRARPN